MEELFENILDKDEKIEKVFKPQKSKFFFSNVLAWCLLILFFSLFGFLGILVPDENGVYPDKKLLIIPIAFIVVCLLLVWLFSTIYYKNLYYAYSNKRIIIRSGIFGVDYKSLDMSMIGAVNVYVSLIDKMLKKNTGSIMFGSTASPIGYGQTAGSYYKFNHIVAPYETCKEIKSFIDEYKKQINGK